MIYIQSKFIVLNKTMAYSWILHSARMSIFIFNFIYMYSIIRNSKIIKNRNSDSLSPFQHDDIDVRVIYEFIICTQLINIKMYIREINNATVFMN